MDPKWKRAVLCDISQLLATFESHCLVLQEIYGIVQCDSVSEQTHLETRCPWQAGASVSPRRALKPENVISHMIEFAPSRHDVETYGFSRISVWPGRSCASFPPLQMSLSLSSIVIQ